MIRYAFSTLLVFAGLASPLLAQGPSSIHALTPASASKGAKPVPTPTATPATAANEAKVQKPVVKDVVTITSDLSRASRAALIASHPQPSSPITTASSRSTPQPTPSQATLVTRNSPVISTSRNNIIAADMGETPVRTNSMSDAATTPGERLARVTAYWSGEGDYYTGRCISATGVRLHDGHCAVDPNIIPYGSVVDIKGVGKFLAVDTGSAVISRTAAREGGQTSQERHAIVVDLYFADRSEGEKFAAGAAKYVSISWWTPSSNGSEARAARSLFAEEDWTKIQGKQL